MSTTKDTRKRNWQFILYPESAPADWLSVLRSFCVNMFISPLHDRDFTALGEPKKPHRHIIVMYGANKSEEQVRKISDAVNGAWCPVGSWHPGGNLPDCMVADLRLAARYHLHLDDANKARYSSADEIVIGCESFEDIIVSGKDDNECLSQVEEFITDNGIFLYNVLVDIARENHPDWLRIIRSHTLHIKSYQKSLQYQLNLR